MLTNSLSAQRLKKDGNYDVKYDERYDEKYDKKYDEKYDKKYYENMCKAQKNIYGVEQHNIIVLSTYHKKIVAMSKTPDRPDSFND